LLKKNYLAVFKDVEITLPNLIEKLGFSYQLQEILPNSLLSHIRSELNNPNGFLVLFFNSLLSTINNKILKNLTQFKKNIFLSKNQNKFITSITKQRKTIKGKNIFLNYQIKTTTQNFLIKLKFTPKTKDKMSTITILNVM
jgi:hypothetical protein